MVPNMEQVIKITYGCKETNKIINCLSRKRTISHGIPQGSVLGSMFLLYINDLEADIEHGIPTFFADDTSIFIADSSVSDVQRKMNNAVNKLTGWLERNRLIIKRKQ
jgi:hypothetical protein